MGIQFPQPPPTPPWKNTPFFKKPGVSGLKTAGSSDSPLEMTAGKFTVAPFEGGVAPGRRSAFSLVSFSSAFLRNDPVFLLQLLCFGGERTLLSRLNDATIVLGACGSISPGPWEVSPALDPPSTPLRWPFGFLIPPKSLSL